MVTEPYCPATAVPAPVLLTVNVFATEPATTPAMLRASARGLPDASKEAELFCLAVMSGSVSAVAYVSTFPVVVLTAVVLIPSNRLLVLGVATGSLLILMLIVAEVLAWPPLP